MPRFEDRLLPALQLVQAVRAEAGRVVLDELARPGVVRGRHLLALRRIVDRVVEIGLQLGEQRIRVVEIDRNGVLPLDLDALFFLKTERRKVERADRAKAELAVPRPFHVFCSKFVAPVALDALTQLESDELAGGIELERLRQLALDGKAGGHVRMVGDVLAKRARLLRIWDLLEFEQVVVQRRDRLERAETDVEVTVEALWRRGRGDDEGGAGRGDRVSDQSAGQRRCTGDAGPALEHITAI